MATIVENRMDDRTICFCIDGNGLFLEQMLIDDCEATPLLFVCKDDSGERYMAVFKGSLKCPKYIVSKISAIQLYSFLNSEMALHELLEGECWRITPCDDICNDIVEQTEYCNVNKSGLPKEPFYMKYLTNHLKEYRDGLEK